MSTHIYVYIREKAIRRETLYRIWFILFDSHCFNQIKMLSVISGGLGLQWLETGFRFQARD